MAQPGTLALDDADVEQGSILSFGYSVDADHVSDTNWVGLWQTVLKLVHDGLLVVMKAGRSEAVVRADVQRLAKREKRVR